MSLQAIPAPHAKRMIDDGAVLVDIREAGEHFRERIPGAYLSPLSRLGDTQIPLTEGKPVIFHCKSGARTLRFAPLLAGKFSAFGPLFILDGGIENWKRAGFAVVREEPKPLSLERQAQIAVGLPILAGTALGIVLSPLFFAIPVALGVGIAVAGPSGLGRATRIIRKMRWNQRLADESVGKTSA